MSDAFADLWNSTGVSKPAEPPRKLGVLAAATPAQAASRNLKPQNDVFSMLAAASSSSSVTSRSVTPARNAPILPIQKASSTGSSTSNVAAAAGGDAFSGLLSGFSSATQSNGTNLTMAQRAALAEKERQERASKSPAPASQVSSAWAGLDALGASSATSSQSSPSSHDPLDDFGFGSLATTAPSARAQSKSPQPPAVADDDWGFGEFISQPTATKASSSTATSSANLFDELDDFMSAPASQPAAASAPPRSNTPGDFDFGDREDGLLNNQSDDEDDILGDLGKPVEQLAAQKPSVRNSPSPQSGQQSRAVSPPPHILGQIVEMGFSLQQARVALAATDTGLDVPAALEMLLSNGAASSSPAPEAQQERQRRPLREAGHERYYGSDEEDAPQRPPQRPPARQPPQSNLSTRERPGRDVTPPDSDAQLKLQEHADKLMAQASEIGLSVFNRANAFWKESKERVQKAYEERSAAASGSSKQNATDGARRNGRPKWMQDAVDDEHPENAPPRSGGGGFRDDHDDSAPPARPQTTRQQPPPRAKDPPKDSPASRMKVGNLFSDEEAPAVYVSPFRRKGPARTHTSEAPSPAPSSAPKAKAAPPRAPSPVALIQRQTVSASQSAIAASNQQKALGTEKFKLGQYGEAEALYTAAIAALPADHLLLVPLYNNRALTRLNNGDAAGAVADSTAVVGLVGPAYHPAREAKVAREDAGARVDLADALVKAWRRRAEAYEGAEKWELARRDWEALAAAEWAAGKVRTDAFVGIGRCRRMLNPEPKAEAAAAPAHASSTRAPAPTRAAAKAKARQRVPTPPSEALNRVREANEAAEAEELEKLELKDAVDAQLGAWRAGKENNIRALIASLDTVLWAELGWQKVGIHELVSPSQVKIRYTKAIAKLHPDKLNVRNTTVKQRMIANGVFGTLNEAWNVFKP